MRIKGCLGGYLLGLIVLSVAALGQSLDLIGPAQMGRCEEGTFMIVLANDTSQTLSNIIVTFTRANANFVYVVNSATLTLPDNSTIPAEPQELAFSSFGMWMKFWGMNTNFRLEKR